MHKLSINNHNVVCLIVLVIINILSFIVDAYIKATLYYRFKKIKSVKTPAVLLRRNCLLYTINKQLTFVLASADFDELILVVNLMERSLLRQDVLIGREVLGPFLRTCDGCNTVWGQLSKSEQPVCYQCLV